MRNNRTQRMKSAYSVGFLVEKQGKPMHMTSSQKRLTERCNCLKNLTSQKTELPLIVNSTDSMCPLDESFGEVTELNDTTDSEVQETMPTVIEIEEYLPSSIPSNR